MTILLRQKPLPQVVRQIVQRDNGAWFDPEDLSTMFQDAAGTTPVTAMEQPVGLWLDKSGNGNHATQSITASRPTLSARYNWLLNSATLSTQSVTTVAAPYTLSFTGTGSVTLSGSATGTLAGTGANNRVSLAFTPTAGTLTLTVTGSVTLAMLAFGTLTTYQAITTATSYDTIGWPKYLRFDGIDDFLNLPYMGLYANGSASVIAAIDELPRSSYDVILGETNMANTIPLYYVAIPNTQGANFYAGMYVSNDTGIPAYDVDTRGNANLSNVGAIASIFSFVDSGANISKFHNSGLADSVAYARTGTGTFTDTKIGVWYRQGLVDPFGGSMYGLIITKSALTDTDRRRCEQFLAGRLSTLGVTLS